MIRVYIAGPMTGVPYHNVPAFEALARDLGKVVEGAGPGHLYDIVSPAEMDGPEIKRFYLNDPTGLLEPADHTWGEFLARDVKLIADDGIEAIVVLPGWERSRGARLETFVGHLKGCKIVRPEYTYQGLVSLWEVPRSQLIRAWEAGE